MVAEAGSAASDAGATLGVCRFVRLEADDTLVLSIDGVTTRLLPFGLAIASPAPPEYRTLSQRLSEVRKPLRCILRDAAASPPRVQILYFAWQDKSGEVWVDFAVTLLERRAARVLPGNFPERAEYLRHRN